MRLVLLTGVRHPHRLVAARLAEAFPRDLVAIAVAPPPSAAAKARLTLARHGVVAFLDYAAGKLYRAVTNGAAPPETDEAGAWTRPDLTVTVDSHNSATTIAQLRSWSPDVIAVYGTAVLRRPLLQALPASFVNLHTGIAPFYRGADTVFWALHNGEPEHVGVTVHLVEPGIDSGPVLRIGRPMLSPDDTAETLFSKCVTLGADLLVQAIRDLADGRADAERQAAHVGREYRSVERGLLAELRLRRTLRRGLLADYIGRP